MQEKNASLSFREGGSDKVYHAHLQAVGDKWIVSFEYGRRGSTLTAGMKTSSPVTYEEAEKVFNKLVAEKTGKGYQFIDGESGGSNAVKIGTKTDTGMRPMLLNEIDESDLENYLEDDSWEMQEKYDGQRLCIRLGSDPIACNRKGQEVIVDHHMKAMQESNLPNGVYDCENMGDYVVVFDYLKEGETKPSWRRLEELDGMNWSDKVRKAMIQRSENGKREMLEELRKNLKEGVVFRQINGLYRAGRPASGGDALKFKFVATCTCIVLEVNKQRSVSVGVRKHDAAYGNICVGNVTVPSNQPIPEVGDFIEVRYLHYFEGGSLYQPLLLGIRDDVEQDTLSSLKRKAE